MTESVIDDILRHERYAMALYGITGQEPPVWDEDAELYLKPMTLLDRASYRNWQYTHDDAPHHRGELFRRVVCDRDGALVFRDERPVDVEEALDTYTLSAVFGRALVMMHGEPGRPLTPPPRRTDA